MLLLLLQSLLLRECCAQSSKLASDNHGCVGSGGGGGGGNGSGGGGSSVRVVGKGIVATALRSDDAELWFLRLGQPLLNQACRPQVELAAAIVRRRAHIPRALKALFHRALPITHATILDTVALVFSRVSGTDAILLGKRKLATESVAQASDIVAAHVVGSCEEEIGFFLKKK